MDRLPRTELEAFDEVKAIHFPSGDQAGSSNLLSERRMLSITCPLGTARISMASPEPTANRFPSGDQAGRLPPPIDSIWLVRRSRMYTRGPGDRRSNAR